MSYVDPRFGQHMRHLRTLRGLAFRRLAALTYYSKSYLHELEASVKGPTPEVAARLDTVLEAQGTLIALVHDADSPLTPDDHDRLHYVTCGLGRIDVPAAQSLAALLAHERRLEDHIGSAPLLAPVQARLPVFERLIADTPDDTALIDLASQWAHFAGWLATTTGDLNTGRHWYARALEWATEAGNPDMIATALSMRGHQEWIKGNHRALISLSRTAARQPASPGVRSVAIQQQARGLALVGDGPGCDAALDRAEDLAIQASERPDHEPPWMYFYDPAFLSLQRGLAQHYLHRFDKAVQLIINGLDQLPADIRRSDWIGWYVCQLAEAHAHAGNTDCAVAAIEEASAIAATTGAARLATDVRRTARLLDI